MNRRHRIPLPRSTAASSTPFTEMRGAPSTGCILCPVLRKKASELQIGDEFYREGYREPNPKQDWSYVVERLQHVPHHDFYGHPSMVIVVHGHNRILGPNTLRLTPDELVWIVDGR